MSAELTLTVLLTADQVRGRVRALAKRSAEEWLRARGHLTAEA